MYYIFDGDTIHKMKIKDIKKLVAIAYNYEGVLYYEDKETGEIKYIYDACESENINNEMLKEYGIKLRLDKETNWWKPYYGDIDLYEKYKDLIL